MFVRVDDKDNVLRYPYTFGNIRMDFPNVSFPADVNDESINHLYVYRVQQTERPTYDDTVNTLVDSVELDNEKWIQKWIVENVNEELAILNVRRKRDRLLSETDWMALFGRNSIWLWWWLTENSTTLLVKYQEPK